jgi:hypothetical protein
LATRGTGNRRRLIQKLFNLLGVMRIKALRAV